MSRLLWKASILGIVGLTFGAGRLAAADRVEHRMDIVLDATGHLQVTEEIVLPPNLTEGGAVEFLLNSALIINNAEPPVEQVPLGDIASFFGINGSSATVSGQIELVRYRVGDLPESGRLQLSYAGDVNFGLSDQREEYTRGFRETAGVLSGEGVYLAGNGFWYPTFNDELVSFELSIKQPAGWHVISQGNGTSRDGSGRAHWSSGSAMDEIYIVGGPLTVYSESVGAAEALVYLREQEPGLAAKYLEATAQYMEMYRKLIGPYPYGKFALVENFWETGYGMPSFTLLGPRVIRFPFILHSSYPHEILHNWWGNSVFVDYATGNWCEGLTAYLADHLIKEQRAQGEEYRRSTLQKYRDFVKETRDFPLSEFRSRHSAATEAVGYGKTMMGFHELRRHLGDEAFQNALVQLYRRYKGRRASFRDLQTVFESASEKNLGWFFDQWTTRPGAPALVVEVEGVTQTSDGFVIEGTLRQVQTGESFIVTVPVAVQTSGDVERTEVKLDAKETSFRIRTTGRPLALYVDSQFDVFRLLDPRETPPSIGQIFGAPEILAVLPARSDAKLRDAYRRLIEDWQSDSHTIRIVSDDEIEQLPKNHSVWVLGKDNRFTADLALDVNGNELTLDGEALNLSDHSFVAVRRHPRADELAIGWLVVEPEAAFPGMGRKLPHYGKYSYLAFEGDEPTNIIKGQWSSSESPLVVDLRPPGDRSSSLKALPLEKRSALAELPPVFSEKRLMQHVSFLASVDLEGRGVGSAGLEAAANYIAERFAEIGLQPGSKDGSWFQRFQLESGPDGGPVETVNVIGFLPGSNREWSEQSTIVSAHYDHLGLGWPDVHRGDEGLIHPGADDNASGVAVMLELARNSAAADPPQRNLVFVAFSAEEAGRAGSKYFAEHPSPFPAQRCAGRHQPRYSGTTFRRSSVGSWYRNG